MIHDQLLKVIAKSNGPSEGELLQIPAYSCNPLEIHFVTGTTREWQMLQTPKHISQSAFRFRGAFHIHTFQMYSIQRRAMVQLQPHAFASKSGLVSMTIRPPMNLPKCCSVIANSFWLSRFSVYLSSSVFWKRLCTAESASASATCVFGRTQIDDRQVWEERQQTIIIQCEYRTIGDGSLAACSKWYRFIGSIRRLLHTITDDFLWLGCYRWSCAWWHFTAFIWVPVWRRHFHSTLKLLRKLWH